MDTLWKPNFIFLSRTHFEKNAVISCKNLKSCTIVLINNFEILQISIAFFSDTVRPRNLKFFFAYKPIWILSANQISCSLVGHFSRKMRWYLEISITLFSDTVRPSNLKLFLYINPYGYSLQIKFHVPRSHTFREKCDDNLKLASHFSPILCDRGT